MCDEVFQLRVDDSPKASLLDCALRMFAVEEGDVEDLPGLVPTMVEEFLVLEVRMLKIAVLLELCHIYVSLSDSRSPAVICQIDRIAESFDTALEDVIIDILDAQLVFEACNELFNFRVVLFRSWSHIFCALAHVPHFNRRDVPTRTMGRKRDDVA